MSQLIRNRFAVLVAALLFAPAALAVSLDPTFGTGGVVQTTFTGGADELKAVRVQTDGKVVAVGNSSTGTVNRFIVARFHANGSPDSSFGVGGRTVTQLAVNGGGPAEAVAIQADGKIIAVGSSNSSPGFALVRYNADGTLDAGFGTDGVLTTWPSGHSGAPFSVQLQPDGKIVAGGYGRGPTSSDNDFVVARYTSAGVLDTTFNGNGVAVLPLSAGDDYGNAIALQSDGKVVIVGHASISGNFRFVIARLNGDGSPDTSFGCTEPPFCSGANSILAGAGPNFARGVAVQSDGRIVVGGMDFGGNTMAAARFNANGTVDTTFGCASAPCNGWTTAGAPGQAAGEDLLVQPDGRIVMAGRAGSGASADMAIFRFESNGLLDASFGAGGRAIIAAAPGNDEAFGVTLQADGKLVAVGGVDLASRDLALVRFLGDGSLDTGFGVGGKVVTDVANAALARSLVLQPDGKMLAAGSTGQASGNDFAVARFNADGSLDTTFGCASPPCSGKSVLAFFSSSDDAFGVALQSTGRIVVAGSTSNGGNLDVAILRLTANGVLDTDFGCTLPPCAGKVVFGFGTAQIEGIHAARVQPDNRIVVAGYSQTADGNHFAIARLTPSGLLDTSFGCSTAPCSGKTLIDFGAGGADTAWALAFQADGKIIVGGEVIRPGYAPAMGVVRLNANGTVDSGFGGGLVVIEFSGYTSLARALAVQPDGKVLVAGRVGIGENFGFGLARLNADGTLDSTFGTGGKVVGDLSPGLAAATALALLPGGRFVATGFVSTAASALEATVIRYLPGGQRDATFGTNGVAALPPTPGDDLAWAAALQPDGRLVLAGEGGTAMVLARLTSVLSAPAEFDFNADAHPDILWSNTANGATYVWYMGGTPPALLSDAFIAQIDPSWQVHGIADFNGDGKPDLVWRNTANGNCYVWYMDGATFTTDAFLFGLPPQWVIQGVADFNADGKPDFLMRNTEPSSGVAFAWFFDNATPIGDQFLFGIDPMWKVEAVADLNADNQPDLLFRNVHPESGLAFVWNTQYSDGVLSLSSSSAPVFSIDPAWEVVQLADWNADGRPDLLFRNANSGVVFVWYLGDNFTLGASDFIIQIDPSWEIVPRR